MTPEDPSASAAAASAASAARLLEVLEGLDLSSADGRAGLGALLTEIERLAPGAIHRQAAGMDLRRLGWARGRPDGPPPPAGR